MPSKDIVYFGRHTTTHCDGRCDKAWGINGRPHVFFDAAGKPSLKPVDDGYDNNAMVPDHLLGEAPADPGTYEGGYGKPDMVEVNANPDLMNKWCVRECERNSTTPEPIRTFDTFRFNMPSTQEQVTSQPGWEENLTQFCVVSEL
jgi:hypothetical protein